MSRIQLNTKTILMKKILHFAPIWLLLVVLMAGFGSCTDLLDASEDDVLTEDEAFQTTYDADVAVIGIYSKVMELAERVVVLNELRADLLDVTSNATADMIALNNHTADADNEYCNTTPFYEVILNCNEVLEQFDKMKAASILDNDNYEERYADVMAVRCWTYLQLGIHFGTVPYVTQAIDTKTEVFNDSLFPEKTLDELLPLLVADMCSLSYMGDYEDVELPENIESGYTVALGFINKRILLGDLYLWNNQYELAAWQYYLLLATADDDYYKYKATSGTWQTSSVPVGFWINFLRYNSGNVNAYGNTWKEMFALGTTDEELQYEMIWAISYDYQYDPAYPFIKLFANTGQGEYRLRPSDYAIDSLWENQTQQSNGFAYDGRGRDASFDWVNGDPVVIKYAYDYYTQTADDNNTIHLDYATPVDPYKQDGRWFLYRAALVHLRYAEAANRAGYPRLAMAMVNYGIASAFALDYPSEIIYSGNVAVDTLVYPAPFDLDAREDDDYTAPWNNQAGIRGRAYLTSRSRPSWATENISDPTLLADSATYYSHIHKDSILWAEEYILEEAALELGFEGHRWEDLLRITRRRMMDDPGNRSNILYKQVAAKFARKGTTAPDLNAESSWYLPKND